MRAAMDDTSALGGGSGDRLVVTDCNTFSIDSKASLIRKRPIEEPLNPYRGDLEGQQNTAGGQGGRHACPALDMQLDLNMSDMQLDSHVSD
jgi:hypothetical protein